MYYLSIVRAALSSIGYSPDLVQVCIARAVCVHTHTHTHTLSLSLSLSLSVVVLTRRLLPLCGWLVAQVVTGFGATGAALVNSGVDKIVFIGSPAVGKLVMRAAADTLTPVVLELGGKDAAIVCEDADFGQVVNLALRGTFQNCGQNCIGLERLVVHAALYDKLVDALAPKVRGVHMGQVGGGRGRECVYVCEREMAE